MRMRQRLSFVFIAILVAIQPYYSIASDSDELTSGEGYIVVPPSPPNQADKPQSGSDAASQAVEQSVSHTPSAEPAESDEQVRMVGTVKLTSGNLNIRKGPTIKDDVIGKLPNGSRVEVLEQLEDWVKIPYQGASAYVSKPYLVISKEIIKPSAGSQKIIVLDPGHGGKDPGAIASDKTYESDLVWRYALAVQETLEQAGYAVLFTRDEKNSCTNYKSIYDELGCRASFASKVGGHLHISLHADANPSKKFRGTVTFYNARKDLDGHQNPFPKESKRLAELVQSHVQPVVGSSDRGIDNKNYYVNRMNSVPSVLIELGVMTNADDLKLLKSAAMPKKVAEALKQAIDQYFITL